MERRAAQRLPIDLSVTCRVPASPCRATLHDISIYGCKLEVPGKPIELGGTALVELPGAKPVAGRVVWIQGRLAGIQFERALNRATAIALGLQPADPAANAPEPAYDESNANGLIRHWFRRLTACFS